MIAWIRGVRFSSLAAAAILLAGCEPDKAPTKPPPRSAPSPQARQKTAKNDGAPRRSADRSNGPQRQGVTFERGSFSTVMRGPDGLVPVRADSALTPAEKDELRKLIAATEAGSMTREEALKATESLVGFSSSEVAPFVVQMLKHNDVEVRGRALALLEGLSGYQVFPAAAAGLKDPDASVRLQAAEVATRLKHAELLPILSTAFRDNDKSVRQVALQAALEQAPTDRVVLLKSAITAPAQDIAISAFGVLEAEPTKAHAPLMMAALDHPDAFIREKAHDTLALMMSKEFKSSAEALTWWASHQQYFDENLVQSLDMPNH